MGFPNSRVVLQRRLMMSAAEPESPILKTPEWLEVLENKRNRPYKLAHEIGAGAPCLVCKDGCKGLNLHFWRKLCIECKCRKEDHEVQEDEDYAQFEILFGAQKVKRTQLMIDAQSKLFDWIPPNIAPDLAVDYLKSIPQSKLPISNSEGARYRKQQLEKQVPLHDVDPNACYNLSDKEMREFQKYLDNLKMNVIGQGKILKYKSPSMLKENVIQETSLNMIATSKDSIIVKSQVAEIIHHLAVEKVPGYNTFSESVHTESYPANVKYFKNPQTFQSISSNIQPQWAVRKKEDKSLNSQDPNLKLDLNLTCPKPFQSLSHAKTEYPLDRSSESCKAGEQDSLGLKKPSFFLSKNFPVQDKQNNNAQQDNNSNLGLQTKSMNEGSLLPLNSKQSLSQNEDRACPYNASVSKDSLSKFNELSVSSTEVPFVPVQECGNIFVPDRVAKEEFFNQNEDAQDVFPTPPATCQHCLEIINSEEVVIKTERGGNSLWHAKCFVCDICKELLVDLMYFYHKRKVYCGRHYAEIMKIPRCYGCDELIFVKEYTIAEGQSYHVRHFCCFHCDEPLGGKQYIPKDSFPVCLNCYQVNYGKNCKTCQLPIAAGEQRVSWKNLDFHVSPKCFRCTHCLKSLLGKKFVLKNANIFCSKDCVQIFSS